MRSWRSNLRRKDHGFTLIELVVVVMIISVLAAIAIPLYTGYIKNVRSSEAIARLGSIMTASKNYYQKKDYWPSIPGQEGYYADFSDSQRFRYSIAEGGGGQEGFSIRADGRDVDGMLGVVVTMTCENAHAGSDVSVVGI